MRALLFLILLFACGSWHVLGQATNYATLEELQQALSRHVTQQKFSRALLGIKVVSATATNLIFEHNADRLCKPASNGKLYSGALALARFGPEFRIRTSVYSSAKPNASGELDGDLVIYGRGDPSFAARFFDGNYEPILRRLTDAIVNSGLRKVNGNLVSDETFFTGPPYGSSWTWEDLQYYYGAAVSALTVQDNVVDLKILPGANAGVPCRIETLPRLQPLRFVNRTKTINAEGSRGISLYKLLNEDVVYVDGQLPQDDKGWADATTVSNPALWFAQLLRAELEKKGIAIAGENKVRSWPEDGPAVLSKVVEIAHTDSPPMSELVSKMMKPSQNLYAHLLFLQAGAAGKNAPAAMQSESQALRELAEFMREIGVARGEVLLEEGSGLSRGALVTPNATVKLLLAMKNGPVSKAFVDALPISGVDGTLRNRLSEPGLKGNVKAKTGTIRYVNTLSGFMKTRGGEELIFSIMLNNYYNTAGSSGRDEVDQIVRMLHRWGAPAKTKN